MKKKEKTESKGTQNEKTSDQMTIQYDFLHTPNTYKVNICHTPADKKRERKAEGSRSQT